ncbi:MAG: B12-binding domain-containing radical SAM protein [Thermodesulfovibrionales bacterium]
MRALLISPNREHIPDPVFPLGIAYVAAALRKRGHETSVLDLCFSGDADRDLSDRIRGFMPDVVGISLRNVDDVSYPKQHSFLEEYRRTVTAVRSLTDAPVVLGGSGFTIMPEEFLEALRADFGIVGEGEEAFPDLLDRMQAGDLPAQRDPTARILRPQSRVACIGGVTPLRKPADVGAYYRLGGMLNIQTKRGCPFGCIYCTYPQIEGRTVRMRDPAGVADEISAMAEQHGVRHFFFVDSIFNYPVDHARAVCGEIVRRRLDVQWTCYAHPAFMTDGLAAAMAAAGCTAVEFGIDSLSDAGLAALGKNFTSGTVSAAARTCRRHGLKFCIFLFAGGPGDDLDAVKTNLDRLDAIGPDAAVIMAGIRIFPGTKLAGLAQQEQGIGRPGLDPVFYLSRGVADRLEQVRDMVAQRKHWIMPGFEVNLYQRLQKLLREKKGIKGPLWEELSKR